MIADFLTKSERHTTTLLYFYISLLRLIYFSLSVQLWETWLLSCHSYMCVRRFIIASTIGWISLCQFYFVPGLLWRFLLKCNWPSVPSQRVPEDLTHESLCTLCDIWYCMVFLDFYVPREDLCCSHMF